MVRVKELSKPLSLDIKGSEDERWNFEEMNQVKGLPWQPDPNTAGMEVKALIILPMEAPAPERAQVETKPTVIRGVAVKRAEYLAMGATPGCNGCRAIVRGDVDHRPRSQECRERVSTWLKRQDDERIQARLTAAQIRQEAQRREDEDRRKAEEEVNEKKRKRTAGLPAKPPVKPAHHRRPRPVSR